MNYAETFSKQISKSQLICQICGDIARGYNFDVITCMSCKAFFRRNARRLSTMNQCEHMYYWNITKATRNICSTCRLRKCFAYGMNPALIRSSKQIQLPTPRPLNLLHHDHSKLTNDQWNLLSNIIHSYDKHDIINLILKMLNKKSSLPLKLRLKPKDTMNFIEQIYENFFELLKYSINFNCLSSHGYRTLFLHNFFFIANINASVAIRETNAFQNPAYMYTCNILFGDELVEKYIRDNQRFLSNRNIYKLFIFVLIFSSNCSIVLYHNNENIQTIFSSIELIHIQNIYVTILWKYLIYIYGHDGAVMHFTMIIKNVLDALIRMEHVLTNVTYLNIFDNVSKLLERYLVLNE